MKKLFIILFFTTVIANGFAQERVLNYDSSAVCESGQTLYYTILNDHEVAETVIVGFSVYPNPTDGTITVETEHAPSLQEPTEYRIINLMGQILMTGTIADPTIDVSALPAGMYFITIGNHTVKLMKQ